MNLRPQFHLRPSPQGLLAWDVRKLIEQAAAQQLQPRLVALSAIAELEQRYWFSEPGDEPTPRAIAEHMMDGMHRAVKRLVQGHPDIWALQLPVTPAPDFIGVAADDLPYED